ncbi:MAG: MBL fold metallo-hydrolase [Haloferacaceae archaeon]
MRRIPLDVETSAPAGSTNAYLLGPDESVLVDPAAPAVADRIDADGVAHVAVTHSHADHVGGVARLAAETDATVWARRGRVDRFVAAAGVTPDRTFREGTTLGDTGVGVLETPGHAPDHVAFEAPAGVVCGDLAVAEGSVAVAAPEGDLRAYLVSLRRLLARDPDRLLPGHGPVVDDPRATLARLAAHRRDRERRVLDAVRAGARTPDDVVDAAYDKDVSAVRDLARATVVAHLEKLAAEGRVRWDPDAERARPA